MVTNPYNQPNRATNNTYNNRANNGTNNNQRSNYRMTYASDMLQQQESQGITPSTSQGGQRNNNSTGNRGETQHPHRGRVRNQRQFGTSVGISLDDGMTDELRACMEAFSSSEPATNKDTSKEKEFDIDDISDVSSASSDGDDILELNIFGKK